MKLNACPYELLQCYACWVQVLFYNGARQDMQYRQFWASVRPLHLLNRLQLVMSATQAAPVDEVGSNRKPHFPNNWQIILRHMQR